MPSEPRGMSSKKRKDPHRPLEHQKRGNKFVRQFRQVCDSDPTQFFFPALKKINLDNAWLQQDGATIHTSRVSMGVLRYRLRSEP
ncbi:hypothetical protein TNCV_3823611 [Trichonephila clavipes]|nr:hypothetical protein TNCV_3823611 [Trichonephila clavipes]